MKFTDLYPIILLALSFLIALAVIIRAWRYYPRPIVKTFLWLMAAIAWWLLTAIVQNVSTTPSVNVFWMKMTYLGITTLPAVWLAFILQYSDKGRWLTRHGLGLLFIIPAVTLVMVWTNDAHHLIWKTISFDSGVYPPIVTVTYGSWFWVHAAYAYILLLVSTIYLSRMFFKTAGIFRTQMGLLLLATLVPWVANFLYIASGIKFPVDPTPVAFVVTGVAILWGLSRTQLLNIMPVAYETIFRSMTDGVIIADKNGLIRETNPSAREILALNKSEISGKTLRQVMPDGENLPELSKIPASGTIVSLGQGTAQRLYSVYVSPITSGQQVSGYIILMHDDTERKKAESDAKEMAILETELNERKKMEEALRESEEKFSISFRSSPEMIIIINLNDGKYTEVNDSFVRVTGYSREELIGHSGEEVNCWASKEDQARMVRIMQEQGKMRNEEFNFRMKNGEIRAWLCSSDRIDIRGKSHLLAVATDITERKRAEAALRESEEKFAVAFNSSPNAICILSTEESRFLEVNEGFTRFTGYTREEAIGRGSIELGLFVSEEDIKSFSDKFQTQGRIFNQEILSRMKSGEIRTGLFSGETIDIGGAQRLILVITDVTELKQAEKALKESEERFSKAFHASPNVMSITRMETGKYIEVNESFTRVTGYSREEVIGRKTSEISRWAKPEDRDVIMKKIRENGRVYDEEIQFRTKSGKIQTLLFSAEKINLGGEPCLISVSTDITERILIEKALRESEEKFSIAFRHSPEMIIITNTETGQYLDVNDSFVRATGYSREELIGHSGDEVNTWSSLEDRDRMIRVLQETGRMRDEEFRIRIKSGELRTWLCSADLVQIAGKPCVIAVATDITDRKRMEETLAKEAIRRRILIEQSSDGIVILDQNGNVYEANRRFAEMLGYSLEEVLKLNVWDWDTQTQFSREQIVEMIKSVDEAGDHFETYHRRKDGTVFDVEISTNGATFEGQKLIFCVCRDITARKQAEAELRFSDAAFMSIHESIIAVDNEENITHWNNISEQMFGIKASEAIGKKFTEIIEAMETNPGDMEKRKERLQKDGYYREEQLFRTINGDIWVDVHAQDMKSNDKLFGRVILASDITEHRKAEQALRASEEKFSKAFRASPETLAITSIKEGRFIDVNESFSLITGYSREEVIGRSSKDINIWARPEERSRMLKILHTQGRVYNEEFSFRMKSGDMRTWLFSAEKINMGTEPCIISITTDITERKKAEEELKLALARVAATNKELEAFSYSVSHDLRSPLRSIDGFSQALMEDYQDRLDLPGQDYLRRLRGASQRMGELIDSILRLSRLTRSEMHRVKVDLTAMAQEIATDLHEAQPKHRGKFYISPGITADGDPQLLKVLLENLLGNAWKFTGKTGEPRIEFGASPDGEKKTYYVKDNGAGFDMAYADKLFGAFQRLHDASEFPGTGIGLATVQRVVSRHGGTVRAEGEPGKGATFYFTLS